MSLRRSLALLGGLALAAGLLPAGAGSATTGPTPVSPSLNPVNSSGAIKNSVFYYDGTTDLTTANAAALKTKLGNPAIVVTTPKSDETAAVDAIHAIGAKAFRYVQFYWAPNNEAYEGINLKLHPDWAFCASGTTRSIGRKTGDGATWFFIDSNEKAVRQQFRTILAGFKADGWDGVMFDRGEAAMTYAETASGNPIWFKKSTCTGDPYKPGASFASSYVNMLGLANASGLMTMVNYGKSPFDTITRMRPSPSDLDCRAKRWSKCTFLDDVWGKVNLVLNETGAHPRDISWRRDFLGNQRAERSTAHGRRTVDLITTATLGGTANQTKPKVYFQWARIKLFNLSVAVNTGDGGCTGTGTVCNRHTLYPELVRTRFGRPLGTAPARQNCSSGSTVRCIWVRRYGQGMSVVNVSSSTRKPTLTTGLSTGRYVWDVANHQWLAGGKKVRKFALGMGPWTGRPLRLFGTKPSTAPN